MAGRRRARGPQTQLAFEALSIEGGLLSADWLARVAQQKAGGQSDAEYRVPKGINLRDDIGRYWRIAQAHWADFAKGRAANADAAALADVFVDAFLKECFGFASLEKVSPITIKDRTYPVGRMALSSRVPVVIAAAGVGLDAPSSALGDGTRKRSAFGLAQEFLNASDDAMWGIASDGLTIRILRDNASLTRPAWIEADLARIFAEERFADFAALWLLAHETRFGSKEGSPHDCALETWRNAGREEGTRAREDLRRGVEDALLALGNGFLSHSENAQIRGALESGTLSKEGLFQELLRLVYRLIFLLTAEERGVLHDPGATELAKALYADGYGMRRLRDRSARRNAYDRFGDLWESLKIVLHGLSRGEALLGLPALGGLFDGDQCPSLDAGKLENRSLLLAVFRLSWLKEDGSLSRVNWRDMGPEELGSVYESLLELVPVVSDGGRKFGFAAGGETKGNARKTTGSYYTPDSLVQVLLDSALEPVVEEAIAKNPGRPKEALLELSIVDPACGSGHFLLSAARRLAAHVARIESNGTPSAEQYRHALRQVVGRCIFGVDLNPMAVELCKVSLWMEAVEPGRPLSFLDSHIQQGNALLGATPELLANGIPDAAWEPIEGDDKKIASALKKQNKADAKANQLLNPPPVSTYARLGAGARAVDDALDENLPAVEAKEKTWRDLVASAAYEHQRFVADLWCSAFVWRKEVGPLRDIAPTDATFRAVQKDAGRATRALRDEVERLRAQYQFFHWHLAFPQVMAKGGFDVVLGNPPWDSLLFSEEEFFADSRPDIACARSAAGRKRLIAELATDDAPLHGRYRSAMRNVAAMNSFVRSGVRYPLCGVGRVNLFALFAELDRSIVSPRGSVGTILPSAIATDNSTRHFFDAIMTEGRLRAFFEFENEGFFSAGKGHMLRFALVTLGGTERRVEEADFFFQGQALDELANPERHFTLSKSDIALINPNTKTCPIFRLRRDVELAKQIYRRVPVLDRDDVPSSKISDAASVEDAENTPRENPWVVGLGRTLNMADDAALFHTRGDLLKIGAQLEGNSFYTTDVRYLPLIEAKMVHQFNHRHGDFGSGAGEEREHRLPDVGEAKLADPRFVPLPFYWVAESEVDARLHRRGWSKQWLFGWRDVTDARASARTVIASAFPRAATSDKLSLILPKTRPCELLGTLSSFVFDYCGRQKVGGIALKQFILRQLPIPLPSMFAEKIGWSVPQTIGEWIRDRVLELTYTAWDLEPFARDVGYAGTPFRWDVERRFQLSCELDAAFFHLYGLSRDDAGYVMETFPVVRRSDEKTHGEYRTKRFILEIYDALARAVQTGTPYRTPLDPLPAAAGASHATFNPQGTPRDYAEALRTGLLFTLVRRSGEAGISSGALSRALHWLEDPKHAASWLAGSTLADFERVRASDALLADGAAEGHAAKLIAALETAKAVTQDAKGIARIRVGGPIPNWLPQTPTLAKLASLMLGALEQAEQGARATADVKARPDGKAKRA